jgi:RNA polymerase sigma-70 factor (ECF subfamily)
MATTGNGSGGHVRAARRLRSSTVREDGRTANDAYLCDLVRAIGEERDHQAFTELFHRLAPQVRRLLLHYGLSWPLAEELTQETMLSVWRHAATFDRRRASVVTWILTIARNKQIDHLRAAGRRQEVAWEPLEPVTSAAEPDGEQALHVKQSGALVNRAIKTLPRAQALVLRQSFGDDKSHQEIAAALGLPLGTVKSRIRLALKQLRTRLPIAELC